MGKAYWSGLVDWLRDTVQGDGKVSAGDLDMFHVTDDVDEVVRIFQEARERHRLTAPEDDEFQNTAEMG
jgi:hypothetical protein